MIWFLITRLASLLKVLPAGEEELVPVKRKKRK